MFFLLSKTISVLFLPLTLIVLALVISMFIKNMLWQKRLRLFAVVFLLVSTNSFLVDNLMKWWEVSVTPMHEVSNQPKVGILLTGVVNLGKLPTDRVYFKSGADRVTHTLHLYKLGKIQKIIISGGTGSLYFQSRKEAPRLAEFLIMSGVSAQDIIIEDASRNTFESARAVKEIVQNQFPNQEYVLITSAFHMRRASACFHKQGIKVLPFSTDFKTNEDPPTIGSFLVPKTGALEKLHVLVKEWMGYTAYKLAGYI